jgi:hypothetical protein
MVALCFALSLAVIPIPSQQTMAAHHASDAVEVSISMVHSGGATTSKPCEKIQYSEADKAGAKCCDASCSTVATFEVGIVPGFGTPRFEYDQVEADELQSRMTFGLKRPPRV